MFIIEIVKLNNGGLAEIIRRDGRGHAGESGAGDGAGDLLRAVHGRWAGGGGVCAGVHDSEFVPATAGRRGVDGGVYSGFQGAGKNGGREGDVAHGQCVGGRAGGGAGGGGGGGVAWDHGGAWVG